MSSGNQLRDIFLSEANIISVKQQVQESLLGQRLPSQFGNNYDDMINKEINKIADQTNSHGRLSTINDSSKVRRRADQLVQYAVDRLAKLIAEDIKNNQNAPSASNQNRMPRGLPGYSSQTAEKGLSDQTYGQRVVMPRTSNSSAVFENGNSYPVQMERNRERLSYKQECHCISIDSRDRDLEIYPNPSQFQVRFAPVPDSYEFPTSVDINGNIITQPVQFYVGDDKGATIDRTYNNIYKMGCCLAILPYGEKRVCDSDPTSEESNHANPAAVSLLNEPYLMLEIPELDGPYEGTNKTARKGFTKLVHDNAYSFALLNQTNNSTFVQMIPTCRESRYWKPTSLGKLDRMTLTLRDSCGLVYNFGQDKLYVASFEQSDTIIEACCPQELDKNATKVTITCSHPDYYDKVCYHELDDGDTVYMYATRPCDKSTIQPNRLFPAGPEFKFTVQDNTLITSLANLSFPLFLSIGDFIVIEGTTYQIVNLTTKVVTLDADTGYTEASPLQNPTIQYAKQNKKGISSDSARCLFYVGGWRKCSRDGSGYNALEFDIGYPWEDMPDYIKDGNYKDNEVFLIKAKLQTSYSFRVITLEKNEGPIISELV